jgi:hypothetical protein
VSFRGSEATEPVAARARACDRGRRQTVVWAVRSTAMLGRTSAGAWAWRFSALPRAAAECSQGMATLTRGRGVTVAGLPIGWLGPEALADEGDAGGRLRQCVARHVLDWMHGPTLRQIGAGR